MGGLFVTATDTGVGKTVITAALTAALKDKGLSVVAMKPVASGCIHLKGNLISEDTDFLIQIGPIEEHERPLINPYCLEPSLAPSIAAELTRVTIDTAKILEAYQSLKERFDFVIVEGVGGIAVPIWEKYLVADLMAELKLPSLIVARPNLGTVNHTLLTAEYAKSRGLEIVGVIINGCDETSADLAEQTNPGLITRLTGLPVLGCFPKLASLDRKSLVDGIIKTINLDQLIRRMEVHHG